MITTILITSLIDFLKILPILIIAIVVSQIVNTYVSKEKIKKISDETEGNIARTSAIGLMTPGPLLAYLPLLKTLQTKGVPLSIIAAFITAQTLIGPARLFLEVGYFGILFFTYRVIIGFLIAIGIATSFKILERYIKF